MNTDTELAPFNMHMHTHFSFNADGLSPTELVEKAVEAKLHAAAICDFDVLDGLDEFHHAADEAGLRSTVGMETRVFISEYADKEINSPGEPGVAYFMGMGFGRLPKADSVAGRMLADLRERSAQRNRAMIARIAEALPGLALDYEETVLPLTPSGNATERHIVRAYAEMAQRDPALLGEVLGISKPDAEALLGDTVKLQNTLRSKLMKRGGVGYVQPDEKTFPPVEDVIAGILDAGAIPMAAWLDGLSDGEADSAAMLECLREKGVCAVNIIPDRNWNLSDASLKAKKVERLNEYIDTASRMGMPINVGTELNSFGLPFVDDFKAEALRPHWPEFYRGANIIVGQSRLARYAGFSYAGDEADARFDAQRGKNDFFMSVGELPVPDAPQREALEALEPDAAYAAIRDAVRKGGWQLG